MPWKFRTFLKNAVFDYVPGMLRKGPSTANRVALTFDDGPDHLTDKYLDLLDHLEVPATFFLIGGRVESNRSIVDAYTRRGHQVAGHGFDHARFPNLSRRELLDQVARTDRVLGIPSGERPWVRPPHGSLDAASIMTLLAANYMIAMWSVDSCDYGTMDPQAVVDRCAPSVIQPGDVLLFHEGQQWTLDALPQIVSGLRANGYECVTMRDLVSP